MLLVHLFTALACLFRVDNAKWSLYGWKKGLGGHYSTLSISEVRRQELNGLKYEGMIWPVKAGNDTMVKLVF